MDQLESTLVLLTFKIQQYIHFYEQKVLYRCKRAGFGKWHNMFIICQWQLFVNRLNIYEKSKGGHHKTEITGCEWSHGRYLHPAPFCCCFILFCNTITTLNAFKFSFLICL